MWLDTLALLRERGRGHRESGGFLLGRRVDGLRTIESFLPYDDVDPHALRGAILFDGSKMDVVWDLCRREGLEVVADIHTHPAGVGQSQTDRENPMIPEVGHVALIVPNFADRVYFPGDIGIYEYCGRRQWTDRNDDAGQYFAVRRFS
ncbi:Mov34/MPN/PAD-1 family protein [Bradyrhizobium sp. 191]|uniref:Mov34/MPN/PAD-1 family protein n=1 Tax=Bradyrhizobium sp. 191 TaxID=2782659 RepID=UPI001FFF2187|nr:Mov34/MPN/PAD-1 family protein [Bradyrhizobium sp. 191]UPJ68530.1 Mov34/MPN/PAD-1 family protein [Bradyrhizobium sp. 191]